MAVISHHGVYHLRQPPRLLRLLLARVLVRVLIDDRAGGAEALDHALEVRPILGLIAGRRVLRQQQRDLLAAPGSTRAASAASVPAPAPAGGDRDAEAEHRHGARDGGTSDTHLVCSRSGLRPPTHSPRPDRCCPPL